MSSSQGLPTTAEEARAVLRIRGLVWLGAVMAVVCLMLAMASFQIGRIDKAPLVQWLVPVFFLLVAVMWVAGLRRLRARIAAARDVLAREEL